ncbi:MAG: hypothetical protein ACREJG_12060 [Candidatus Rokuibacteriota bacterium]
MAKRGTAFWKRVGVITAGLVLPFGGVLLLAYGVTTLARSRKQATGDPYVEWLRRRDAERARWRDKDGAGALRS